VESLCGVSVVMAAGGGGAMCGRNDEAPAGTQTELGAMNRGLDCDCLGDFRQTQVGIGADGGIGVKIW
jgi:hypothetical protein